MGPVEHLGIPYLPAAAPNPLQTFDVYLPSHPPDDASQQDASTLICFFHGGAWRTEDKLGYAPLARKLVRSTGHPVVVPNYRLTPTAPTPDNYLYHPAHAEDALRFLEFILSWHTGNGGRLPRKPSRLFLVGHSCSAHMLSTIFLRMPGDSESVRPSNELIQSTAAIIMSEGTYDIDLLLSRFPQYRSWFIENAFGKRDSFEDVSVTKAAINPDTQHIRWFIIHSKGDTQVDEQQSEEMYAFLKQQSCLVFKSFDNLKDEHDEILNSPEYITMVSSYIAGAIGAEAV